MLAVDDMRWVVIRAVLGGGGGDLASMRRSQDDVRRKRRGDSLVPATIMRGESPPEDVQCWPEEAFTHAALSLPRP